MKKHKKGLIPNLAQDAKGIWWVCKKCGAKLWCIMGSTIRIAPDEMPNYCPKCGKPVQWDSWDSQEKQTGL